MSTDRPRILAIDDASDLLALMAKVLGADYEVDTAGDAGAGIDKAFADPQPDLILLDVEMPQVSGFEVCRALKGETATAGIPIIFLTGKTEAQAQVEAFDLGAVDYITKPINAKVLKARVRMHLALADRRYELERLVKERTEQLERTRAELIKRLGRAMQMHESAAVGNRVTRLGHYAKLIAQAAGAKKEVAEMMLIAAPLHDIGKLGVPAEILQKRDKLSAQKAWIRHSCEGQLEKILASLKAWKKLEQWLDMQYVKLPATWLNGECFEETPVDGSSQENLMEKSKELERKLEAGGTNGRGRPGIIHQDTDRNADGELQQKRESDTD